MIDIVNVWHHYTVRPVLRGVNLAVRPGELLALMGPNGMGKSTLMQILAGLITPYKGHVEIKGVRRRSSPENELEIRRKVVYLPAEPYLPDSMTGREWVFAVGKIYGIEDHHLMDHVERLLVLFDLKEQGDEMMTAYSTGQRKKISLCAALVAEAPVMLLDEPFSGGLDPSGIMALKRVLQHLARRDDVTIVLATPVPELVEELADRVAVLSDGRIVACDTVDGLRKITGVNGALGEIYEHLVSPEKVHQIEDYFREGH